MSRQKEYYCFHKPNQMSDHKYTDDVALCKATSLQQAIKIFRTMYADVTENDVFLVKDAFNYKGIVVCTDY